MGRARLVRSRGHVMAYLSTDPNAGQPINRGGPVGTARLDGTVNTLGQLSGNPTDPGYIDSILQQWSTQPGADPILQTPEGRAYYQQKILETGGLNAQNMGYWQNKSTLAQFGGQVGGRGGTGVNFGNFAAPSLEDARNSPGYQFAFEQGQRAVQTGAAAKGTLLTGGTLKDLAQLGTGLADTYYNNRFNQAALVNSQNFGQNSTIADLGLRATTSSFA